MIEPQCEVGGGFSDTTFSDGGSGVASGYREAGPKDFPSGGYRLAVENGVQVCEITAGAPTNGDAGIIRTFEAQPGEEYSLVATARIRDASPGFKARLTLAAKQGRKRQIQEFNDRLEDALEGFSRMEIPSAALPEGTRLITVKFRAHSKGPGDHGIAELAALELVRIR